MVSEVGWLVLVGLKVGSAEIVGVLDVGGEVTVGEYVGILGGGDGTRVQLISSTVAR